MLKKKHSVYLLVILFVTFSFSVLYISTKTSENIVKSKIDTTIRTQTENKVIEIKNTDLNLLSEDEKYTWMVYKKYFPKKYTDQIEKLEIITQDNDLTVASIEKLENRNNFFKLKINIKNLKNTSLNKKLEVKSILPILIHETAHQISLQDDQLVKNTNVNLGLKNEEYKNEFNVKQKVCSPNYYLKEGCSRDTSMINRFYQKFWMESWAVYNNIQNTQNDENFRSKMLEFYQNNTDSFISENAFFSPEEDFAESFRYFILSPGPLESKTKDQKLLFFYEFDDLVDFKKEVQGKMLLIDNLQNN
jgi:hypothetical protein